MPTSFETTLDQLDADRDAAVDRLKQFLSIPSVSTDPAYGEHIQTCVHWLADQLRELGLQTEVMPTDGHPVVIAHTTEADVFDQAGESTAPPRVLFYGHYDVQPPDPLDQWTSPPFEPTVRDNPETDEGPAVFARGALDDKGQTAMFLEAVRAWKLTHGKLPCHLTILIEGEEEIGSANLPAFLEANPDRVRADVALISDTGMWQPSSESEAQGAEDVQPIPAITYGLRGMVTCDIQLHGPSRDLHSGMYGGTLANPATMLPRVLARLWDEDNRITIPGFYDDVVEPTNAERTQWEQLGFDERKSLGEIGAQPFGEAGRSTLERRWSRPACDVNGLYGGYMGEGAKTVIPTYAGAKLSFRIPPEMDPSNVARRFTDWLHAQDVGGCRWKITLHGQAHPVQVPINSPWMDAARQGIEQATNKAPALIREGATIPIVAELKTRLGLDVLLVGFGLESDHIHSPDEHFGLSRFHLGARTHVHLLHTLAQVSITDS